jgi:hypothetical protein
LLSRYRRPASEVTVDIADDTAPLVVAVGGELALERVRQRDDVLAADVPLRFGCGR